MNPLLLNFLAGPSGKTSSMRVATLLVVVGVLGPWAWVYVESGGAQQLDNDMVLLVLGALGIKGWQRSVEQRDGGSKSGQLPSG